MNNKVFNIDLAALYESIGDEKTSYGYHIEHTEDDGNVFNDLCQECPRTVFAYDGEECRVMYEFTDCLSIYNSANIPFWLSKEEFGVVRH